MITQGLRERADRLRAIPLLQVLDSLGAARDRHDRAKWRTRKGTISVNGSKFMNWSRGVGGGGAIDLVIHLEDLNFMGALAWLSQRFPGASTASDSRPPGRSPSRPRELRLPPPDTAKLPRVTRYLVDERRLSQAVVYPLVESGRIYADARGNTVFLMLGDHARPVGAELRGTTPRPWRGMAPGSRKDLGCFSVSAPQPTSTVLCESAIDALSCYVLHPDRECISTAGARPSPHWLEPLLDMGREVLCGFDADDAGDEAARTMIACHPSVKRLRPPLHDWNDVLTAHS